MNKIKIALLLIISLMLASCGGSDDPVTPNPDDVSEITSYYPGNIGSTFTFNTDTALVNTNFSQVGTRVSTFESTVNKNSIEYILQKNISTIANNSIETELNFRRGENGLYIYIDTTGFSSALDELLTDSLIVSVVSGFEIDPEINIFSLPLFSGKEWSAFKFNVLINFLGVQIPITVIEVKGTYEGKESIVVPALNNSVESEKIKYTLIFSLPDPENPINFTNPQNPINLISREFYGYGWYTKDVGLTKLEGSAFLINSINGNGIDLADTTAIVRETLVSYDLK
ncbi:MAG: hypothetical protein CMF23_13115 [Ignavibacteriae bacterium]|nr:hypothetical protein [Ignavibacteriota bacterium]